VFPQRGGAGLQAAHGLAVGEAFEGPEHLTVATTSAGTEGRPRLVGNRSANSSSGNTAPRCSARKACTEPSPSRCRHSADASSNVRSGREEPCIPPLDRAHVRIANPWGYP